MGYFMRYLASGGADPSFEAIAALLSALDASYKLVHTDLPELRELYWQDRLIALLEINTPEDEIFEDDIASFQEVLSAAPENATTAKIKDILANVTSTVVVEAIWDGDQSEDVLAHLDPLWTWLEDNFVGIAQADGEGFYAKGTLIYECRFTL